MVTVQTDVCYFYGCVLFQLRLHFQDEVVWLSQVAHDHPALEICSGKKITIGLRCDKRRSNLLLVVVDNFWRPLFDVAESDLPELDRLVGTCCDKQLLAASRRLQWVITCRASVLHLLTEYVGNVVVMSGELLHRCSLIEAKEIDLIVHAGQCI